MQYDDLLPSECVDAFTICRILFEDHEDIQMRKMTRIHRNSNLALNLC